MCLLAYNLSKSNDALIKPLGSGIMGGEREQAKPDCRVS